MSDKITGSCLCKAVQYEMPTAIKLVGNCHCTICRKLTGAAFSSVAIVAEDDLSITKGLSKLRTYQVNENGRKYFCDICGTPIYNLNKLFPGRKMVCLGSFDEPAVVIPTVNVHCESKLPWVFSIEKLKSFEKNMS